MNRESEELGTGKQDAPKAEGATGRKGMVRLGLLVLLVAGAFGTGGYLIGSSTGEDLDAARAEGKSVGEEAGAKRGTAKGYAAGFRRGRAKGFERAFAPSYRKSYARAFVDAGLERPARKEIRVPKR